MSDTLNYIELAAEIVSAYVSNNSVPASDLPALDRRRSRRRSCASQAGRRSLFLRSPSLPSRPRSRSPTIISICLEDGRKFKSLKRHLRTQYNLSPEEYREKWGLAADYPMVAPAYAKARSALAKQMGLGQQRRRRK